MHRRLIVPQSLLCIVLIDCSCLLLCSTYLAAAPMRLSEYQKQDWQVEDGLPQSNVRMILQMPDRTLLIATSGGIVSFDGIHFKPVKVDDRDANANEAVNALMLARNGDLWIGTDGRGIVVQNKSGSTIRLSEQQGFGHDRVRSFYQMPDGSVWAATQNGIEHIRDGKIEWLKQYGMISGDITTPFAEDGHGGLLFITSRGMFAWRNGAAYSFELHAPEIGAPVAVYRDPHKRVWVGTMRGILELIPRGSGWDEVPNRNVHGTVTTLVGDRDGNLWVGTRHHGICRIAQNGNLDYWASQNGLPNDAIRSMFVDDEQNIWIGMLNGGMSRWRKAPLIPFGKPEGFPAEYAANVFSARDGDMWMGTWGKGLFRMHDGKLEAKPLPGTPITMPIRALAQDRWGEIWVGTWFSGIYRYDGTAFRHYLIGTESPGNAVSAIEFDEEGAMWVGMYTGLMRFAGGVPEKGKGKMLLGGQLITCLHVDADGSMLVGSSTGLYRVFGSQVKAIKGLSDENVLSISRDLSGNTWIGTKAGGIDLLRGDEARHISNHEGIPEFPVFSLIDDGHGYVWMGTTRGVLRVPSNQMNQLAHGQHVENDSVLLNKSDGMRSSECGGPSQPNAVLAKDGSIWFVTARGFVHTAPISGDHWIPPAVARIRSVTLDGESSDTSGLLNLRPTLKDLVIHFAAIRLGNPWQVEYRYRLAGYDKDWTVTMGRAVHYKRLPPGEYKFELQARDEGSSWNTSLSELAIHQRPFFYQTRWFIISMIALLTLLIVQFFRWRVARMKGALGVVVEERNRIAREWHDTLMAGFAAISWQLETTARLFRESGSAPEPAMRSCELARNMVSHCQAEARRIIWDLRDTDEPSDRLSIALERTLSTIGTSSDIEKRLEVVGHEVPLAPGSVHQLVRIGQEAVSNALRHANPRSILIRLHYVGNALNLSVKDDGRGFQTSITHDALRGHFGIPMMEERARKLGGTLRVDSVVGRGTEIVVSVPFQMPAMAAGVQA